ncbi:MAG: TonB-dependent receptor [Pseudomonadota bacterium]
MFKPKAGVALGALIMVASGAYAQNVETTETDDGEARQQTVVVTGQKIERSVQDTQASVEVITDLDIREENILDLVDALERTANVTTRDGSNFVIRGINSTSVSGAGQGNLATVYLDGIALPRQALFGAPVEIWDISQIEILRGPQSTLQGRASLAGAIVVNTANPTYEWTGRGRAIYTSEEDRASLAAAFGGPIIEDQVAFRLAGERSKSDGFETNTFLGRPSDPQETESLRGKLLIEPNAIPGLEINLTASTSETSDGESFVLLSANDPEEAREIGLDTPTRYVTTVDTATAIVDYEINDNWSITSLTGWNEVNYSFLFDVNRDPTSPEELFFEEIRETLQQEIRATYVSDQFELIFGGFISEEDTPRSFNEGQRAINLEQDIGLSLLLQAPPFSLPPAFAAVVSDAYPENAFINTTSDFTQKIETWAIYNDSTWNLNDQWTLYGGFRYDVEKQSNTNETLVTVATPLPPNNVFDGTPFAALNPVVAGVNAFLIAGTVDASSPLTAFESPEFGGFLPKFGARYEFDDDRSVSFTVQRGYRSGGAAINAAQSEAYDFDQEFTWNYELALRSQWMDGLVTLNANVFYIDWTDQQVRVQLSNNVFDTEIQNAGSSNVRGFELEGYFDATEDLDLYGSVGYAKTEFDEFNVFRSGVAVDLSGNEFGGAPEWTWNVGATWRPGQNWIANINANYADDAFLRSDDFQLTQDIDARTLVNFRAGWENDNFGIYLAGNNILDEDYVLSQFPNISNATTRADAVANPPVASFAQFGDPRTFSIQLETRF